jgi:hypothetical protein
VLVVLTRASATAHADEGNGVATDSTAVHATHSFVTEPGRNRTMT